jgi:glucosamine--fructose-6-phosphate aminotransferase (isomerizing)
MPNDVNSSTYFKFWRFSHRAQRNYWKLCSFEGRIDKRGYVFHSDTDTEVLINLIEEVQKETD